jgi:small subunit ribosomal protein S1
MAKSDLEKDEMCGYVKDADGNLIPDYEGTIKVFDNGDLVSGQVVKIDRDEVLVDVGYKSEGVIPASELSIQRDVNPSRVVCLGEEICALVLQKEDKEGRLILSKKRAEYEQAWSKLEKIGKEGGIVEGKAVEVVKGGLIVNIGLRGFLPASLVDIRRVKDLRQYLNKKLKCKIIEMDRNRNNVVLSRRAVLDDERKHEREKILSQIKIGQTVTGQVSSIVDFGAFVDLGGIDGLVHISELSWDHINHPSEVLKVGQDVEVKVLDIDMNRGRVSLGLKQTQKDPWMQKLENYEVGQSVCGKISKLVSFGAFVSILDEIEGLAHISELSDQDIEVPDQVVEIGQEIEARIISIDTEKRRVNLSLRKEGTSKDKEKSDSEKDDSKGAPVTKEQPKSKIVDNVSKLEEQSSEESTNSREKVKKAKKSSKKVEKKDDDVSQQVTESVKLIEKKTKEEIESMIPPPEPGSLEDVVQQMKQVRGDKK